MNAFEVSPNILYPEERKEYQISLKTFDLHSQIVEVFRYYIDKMKGNKNLTQKEDRFKSQKPKGIIKMKKSVVSDVVAERFSVDFIGKMISGTKASFDKAKKGNGPIYEELARKVANHPDFDLVEILPKKPATLLKNVLGKESGDVVVKFDDRSAEIEYGEGKLSCRLIEGRYPNYNSVIPQNNTNHLTIDRRALIGALRRVLPFASESSQLVRLHLEAGKLELESKDVDFATSARENITCDYAGLTMDIGFKGSSLTEILNNLSSDEVTIQLADPSRAGVIVPAQQPEGEDILMLIMPMLLND